MAAVIVPLYGLAGNYLASAQGAVTNATIVQFLFTWRGVVFVCLTLFLLLVGFVIETNGYIVLTARACHGRPETSYRELLRYGLVRSKNLWGLGSVILVFYLAVIVPISGVGFNLSFLQGIKPPNFISSFIEFSTLYSTIYFLVVGLFVLIATACIFTLHLIVLLDFRVWQALKTSVRLVRRHLKVVLVEVGLKVLLAAGIVAAGVGLWWTIVAELLDAFGADSLPSRIFFSGLLLIQYLATFLFLLIEVPYFVNLTTRALYTVMSRDDRLWQFADYYPELPPKRKQSIIDRLFTQWRRVLAVVAVGFLAAAGIAGTHFEEIFRPQYDVKVVSHRAGGYGTPENSLSGLQYAMRIGSAWTEIDVQRTADGHYILNHDDTFARTGRDRRAPREMTLAEVKGIDISLTGDGSEHPPTLEEFLRAAHDKVKVIIELKGTTADPQMAHDIVAMVKELGMEEQVMLMGLDYDLVHFVETTYPEIDTGYVYFFSIGDVTRLTGDYIIVEEGEATSGRLNALQIAGKKTMVWTVNERSGMDRFATEEIAAIITDMPQQALEVLKENRELSDTEWFERIFFDR